MKASAQHSGAIALTAFCNGETAKTFWRPHESLDAAMTRAAQRIYGTEGGMYVDSEWRIRHSDPHYWEIEARVMRLRPYVRLGIIRCRLTDDNGSLPRYLAQIRG